MKIKKSCERILPWISAHNNQKWFFLWKWIPTFLQILPRISAHYIILTFSRRYSYFFRNEKKNYVRGFYLKYLLISIRNNFFMKLNCDIFENFTSNICSSQWSHWNGFLESIATFSEIHSELCATILPGISTHYNFIFATFIPNIC